jgi:hemerythrin superfamily protein
MTELIERLETQHNEVDELFTQFETSGYDKRFGIYTKIERALKAHDELEDAELYPTLEAKNATLAQVCRDAHELVKQKLAQISVTPPARPQFAALVMQLAAMVRNHVEQERGQVFPLLQDNG